MDLAYTGPVTISSSATIDNLWMRTTTDLILSPGAVLNVTGTADISGSLTLRANSRFYISGRLLNATAMMCALLILACVCLIGAAMQVPPDRGWHASVN